MMVSQHYHSISLSIESDQNAFIRFLSYKCKVQKDPHCYNKIFNFLKDREKYQNLSYLHKLINNQIDC